jgi:hypothetical protein
VSALTPLEVEGLRRFFAGSGAALGEKSSLGAQLERARLGLTRQTSSPDFADVLGQDTVDWLKVDRRLRAAGPKARGRTTDAPAPARHEARYGADPTVHPQHDDGAAGRAWHEASVGTLSFWDAEGEHLRTIYLAQMPESGKATLCEGLTDELLAVVAERPELRLTFASDGARAHWTALEAMAAKLPAEASGERAFVLDFFHAAEYLTAAANEAYGEGTPQAKIEAAHWRETLREHPEGAARVLASLRYHRARASSEAAAEELDSIISYLAANANAGRMGYAAVKGEGLPIGTGVTEAAAKTLISVRMKRAGARYSQHGGQTILLFRSALLSQRFEALSEHLEATYRATLQAALRQARAGYAPRAVRSRPGPGAPVGKDTPVGLCRIGLSARGGGFGDGAAGRWVQHR